MLVTSKGDDALLDLDCRAAWHFPPQDGRWVGFHPPGRRLGDRAARARAGRGADYLVIPATSTWWLERYPAFADHLTLHYPRRGGRPCAIFALGRFPAFYGREHEEMVRGHRRPVRPICYRKPPGRSRARGLHEE